MPLLKLALRPWRNHFLSQFAVAVTLGNLLFLTFLMAWFESGLDPLISRLQRSQVVTAYLSPEVPEIEEKKILDSIRVSMGAAPNQLDRISFTDRNEFLSNLEGEYPELTDILIGLGAEMKRVVPKFVSAEGEFSDTVVSGIKSIPGVQEVTTSSHFADHSVGTLVAIQWIVRLIFFGLIIAMVTVSLQLTRINKGVFASSLKLFRNWGGGFFASRLPQIIASLSVGLLGGLAGAVLWFFVSRTFAANLKQTSDTLVSLSSPHPVWALAILGVGVFLGLVSGGLQRK